MHGSGMMRKGRPPTLHHDLGPLIAALCGRQPAVVLQAVKPLRCGASSATPAVPEDRYLAHRAYGLSVEVAGSRPVKWAFSMDFLLYGAIPNDLRGFATCPSLRKGGKPLFPSSL